MEAITKFRADDGTEFADADDAKAHEALCAEIDAVMRTLPPMPKDDGCNFSNGHGFIQHDPVTFNAARHALLRIADRVCPHRRIRESIADDTAHSSWAGRIISESSMPLSRAWYRIEKTDTKFREWGQPYYANNPDKGEQFCLNPKID